jgi:hypothetical protein
MTRCRRCTSCHSRTSTFPRTENPSPPQTTIEDEYDKGKASNPHQFSLSDEHGCPLPWSAPTGCPLRAPPKEDKAALFESQRPVPR